MDIAEDLLLVASRRHGLLDHMQYSTCFDQLLISADWFLAKHELRLNQVLFHSQPTHLTALAANNFELMCLLPLQ